MCDRRFSCRSTPTTRPSRSSLEGASHSGAIPAQYSWAPDVEEYAFAHGHDVEKARQLLAEAGHPNGIDLDFIYPTQTDPAYDRGAQVVQSQAAEAGIRFKLIALDFTAWVDRIVSHDYDIYGNVHSWFADPGDYVRPREEVSNERPATVMKMWDEAIAAPTLDEYFDALGRLALEEDRTAFNISGLASQNVAVAYRSGLKNVTPDFTLTWLYLSRVSQ